MRDHSHKFLFLALTGLMSAACIYASQAGPTLLVGDDAVQSKAIEVVATQDGQASLDQDALSKDSIAAKLASDEACPDTGNNPRALCRAKSKISLSSP